MGKSVGGIRLGDGLRPGFAVVADDPLADIQEKFASENGLGWHRAHEISRGRVAGVGLDVAELEGP